MSRRNARRALLAAAATVAFVTLGGSRADADLVVDLRAVALNGLPLSGSNNAKTVFVSGQPGDVVTLDLWGVVSGTDGFNNEGLVSAHGSVISPGSLLGNIVGGPVAPFADSGSQNGSSQDIDSDGDLDVGVVPNGGTPGTGWFIARAAALQTNGTRTDANTEEFRIGQFTFTVTGGTSDTFVSYFRRANAAGGNIVTSAVWSQDGAAMDPVLRPYRVGAPVHIVPEPAAASTVATAAALSAVGLRSRWRR
jgi:hypothetical protein